MDYSAALSHAQAAFQQHPTQTNLNRLYDAVNAFQVNVTLLDQPLLDEFRALVATEAEVTDPGSLHTGGAGAAQAMFQKDGLHVNGMTLPWVGLVAVAGAIYLAWKGRGK